MGEAVVAVREKGVGGAGEEEEEVGGACDEGVDGGGWHEEWGGEDDGW